MLVLSMKSLAALVFAQLLPGLLLVKLLDVGRGRFERLVLAGILGGPLAALVYWLTLASDWEPLYWVLLVNLGAAAVILPYRSRTRGQLSLGDVGVVAAWLAVLVVPYLLTTGSLYRLDDDGNLLLDQALQRDALFHVGITRSLEHDYPPALLSVSGLPVGYHVGYHLQLAAWARFFDIDAFDGLIRTGTVWQLWLLAASALMLAARFTGSAAARRLSPILLFGAGLGFVFFFRESVDWWSLVFLDVTLVSLFLANPLLPALPLAFAGLCLLADYLSEQGRGSLAGAALCFAFVLLVKMFLGAQLLAALGLAVVLMPREKRLRKAFLVSVLACLPVLAHTLLAAEGSNTSVGVRPFEIVRYAMEKLDFERLVSALAEAGKLRASFTGWVIALGATLFWLIGFLGLRLAGLAGWARDLGSGRAFRRTLAAFVLIGFPVALVFRIAPAEVESLSRLDAQNDIVWFAAASGMLLWFWTAEAVRGRGLAAAALLVAMPGTVQHFVYEASLEPDRVGRERVFAARLARSLSPPDAVWLDPVDRSRPSLLPYLSGRAVVYDPYVGYDYMFVGSEEIEFRRHALAQFWSSTDSAYRAWVLEHFDVDFVWQSAVPMAPVPGLPAVHTSDNVQLFRVHPLPLRRAAVASIATPETLPLGGAGSPYFGSGWERRGLTRALHAGDGRLYLPRASGVSHRMTLGVQPNHGGGELVVDGDPVEVDASALSVEVVLPPRELRGLQAVALEWRGERPLVVYELAIR